MEDGRVTKIALNLITGRTIQQGVAMEGRKEKDAYTKAAGIIEMAGIGPEDVSVAEVHDASSPAELIIYEELGLCPPGEGGRLIDEGITELGGKIPVNTSGGLLAKGHPVGATGVAQLYELFLQLRGEAGDPGCDHRRPHPAG
jgi:acetyl-CoA acetyltransferase